MRTPRAFAEHDLARPDALAVADALPRIDQTDARAPGDLMRGRPPTRDTQEPA